VSTVFQSESLKAERSEHRGEENIKLPVNEICCEFVNWIQLAPDINSRIL
jgi:hypothetical protein